MIKLEGYLLPLYLMHKIIKHEGNEKVLSYIGAWVAAKYQKLIDTSKIPDSFKQFIRKEGANSKGESIYPNGVIKMNEKRYLDSPEFLKDVINNTTLGIQNIISMEAEVESRFPGTLNALGRGGPDSWDKTDTKKMASKVVLSYLKYSSGSGVRLFLDDVRDPKEYKVQDVLWVKNYKEAIEQLKTGKVTWVSFDHDLGEGKSGYDVAKYIEEGVFNGDIPCPEWQIHSSNPKGRRDIEMAMKSAERFKN